MRLVVVLSYCSECPAEFCAVGAPYRNDVLSCVIFGWVVPCRMGKDLME